MTNLVGEVTSESPNLLFRMKYVTPKPLKTWSAIRKAEWLHYRDYLTCTTTGRDVLKYELRKEAIDCSTDEDKEKIMAMLKDGQFTDSITYFKNRPGSVGLYHCDYGFCKEEDVHTIRKQLQQNQGNIYDCVISCKNKGSYVDLYTAEQAVRVFEKNYKTLFQNTAYSIDNIAFSVALHKNTNHTHIHVMFYEKQPMHLNKHGETEYTYKGNLPYKNIAKFREDFEKTLLKENASEIKTDRLQLLAAIKTIMQNKTSNFNEAQMDAFRLSYKLPRSGRTSYDSENMMGLRAEVDKITSNILLRTRVKDEWNTFEKNLNEYQKSLNEIKSYGQKENGENKAEIENKETSYSAKVLDDIYRRIGNLVICEAKEFKKIRDKVDGNKYDPLMSKPENKKIKTTSKRLFAKMFRRLSGKGFSGEAKDYFDELIKRLEEERKKLQEEQRGYVQ